MEVTLSWKGVKSRSNDRGRTTNSQCTMHGTYTVAQLKVNFTKCTNTKIHHRNMLYVKKMRHRNAKI